MPIGDTPKNPKHRRVSAPDTRRNAKKHPYYHRRHKNRVWGRYGRVTGDARGGISFPFS